MADDEEIQQQEEDEDPVCYKSVLEEKCGEKASCRKLKEVLEECNDRVNGKSNTTETCVEELSDFIVCVDKCIAKNLFQKLK
ncbi:PREDICTED: cytochrome b-c1 complex subunit 6, mitochondrial-like [Amphimedon queenslandica]|uniref:Cytochrome b-c1 complex subunit 6 n=1 Tax=Amphimedon queenslandica TaxID=400682 RepID=A0A1X7SXL5_AMPQE|nr:PREDICTED: cytochrome b-c1 complex subunit 6, mitochondrial-like [Amphimedon queenslandica]|eukprot:XP_011408620.1 PREDICTED: cytochrome b-c1 complex subunit 6, mitochondrial-like [Amphimedon queenslandica]